MAAVDRGTPKGGEKNRDRERRKRERRRGTENRGRRKRQNISGKILEFWDLSSQSFLGLRNCIWIVIIYNDGVYSIVGFL